MSTIAVAIAQKASNESHLLTFASIGYASSLKVLIDAGTDVNARDAENMTALHHAASVGSRACIRLLVATGRCDYLIQDIHGRYASDLAHEWARDMALTRLLRKKQRHQAFQQGKAAWAAKKSGD